MMHLALVYSPVGARFPVRSVVRTSTVITRKLRPSEIGQSPCHLAVSEARRGESSRDRARVGEDRASVYRKYRERLRFAVQDAFDCALAQVVSLMAARGCDASLIAEIAAWIVEQHLPRGLHPHRESVSSVLVDLHLCAEFASVSTEIGLDPRIGFIARLEREHHRAAVVGRVGQDLRELRETGARTGTSRMNGHEERELVRPGVTTKLGRNSR